MENSKFLMALADVYGDELMYCGTEIPDYEFSGKFEKRMKSMIRRRRRPWFRFVSTSGKRAACAAVALLVLSASSMSVEAVRTAVYGFVENVFTDHNEMYFGENDGDYPEVIEEEYEIEVPEGFELKDEIYMPTSVDKWYTSQDCYINFCQYVKSHYKLNYDNEHSVYSEFIDENDQLYIVIDTGNGYFYIWNNESYVFEIYSNLNKDMIAKICMSTKCRK